jgi:hypothetical protein
MWQKHKIHLANFDQATLRVIWLHGGPLLACGHIEISRADSARRNSLLMWPCVRLQNTCPVVLFVVRTSG